MTNKGLSKVAFYLLDRLTDWSPSHVPPIFQSAFQTIMGNRVVHLLYQWYYRRKLLRIKHFDKLLVVSDVNLGDGIMLYASVEVLRFYFPDAHIDYACNRTAGELLSGLTPANHVFRIFSGKGVPAQEDLDVIRKIIERENYSLVLNFSPFVSKNNLKSNTPIIQMYIPLASYLVRLSCERESVRHLSPVVHALMNSLLAPVLKRIDKRGVKENNAPAVPRYKGNSIYCEAEDRNRADEFLLRNGLSHDNHIVFLNPDAAMRFTQMPVNLQIQIMQKLAASDSVDAILLGTGRSFKDVERKIFFSLTESQRAKVVIVPNVYPGMYAALTDRCDVFLSSDTGPVHIAAARKVTAPFDAPLRNRTAVMTVFGSGDSKMYGYDSRKIGHIAASQQAPSAVFVADAACRNITCANKWGKTCNEVRCFTGLSAEEIVHYILTYMGTLRKRTEYEHEPIAHCVVRA